MTRHTKRFCEARTELATRAARYRAVVSTLPSVVPLRATMSPPHPLRSIYRAPVSDSAEILVVDNMFAGRVLAATLEPSQNGGWVFALRDFERSQLYGGSAKRAILIPLRNLADVADALCEALGRAAQLHGLSLDDGEAPQ